MNDEKDYIRHTIFFDRNSKELYDNFLRWKKREGIKEFNQAFRKALERGIGGVSMDDRMVELEKKMESILKFLKHQGVEL